MNRTEFLKRCGVVCGGGVLVTFLQHCTSSRIVAGTLDESDLVVPLSEFKFEKNGVVHFRDYLVVQHDKLEYPIGVYRPGAGDVYRAIWMRCTHQGTELQALGDKLHCPAHGSEFSISGAVENGPAVEALRTFSVAVRDEHLRISLK